MSMQEMSAVAPLYVPADESFWTEAKVDQLRQLVANGVRGTNLTAALGCTRGMLYSKIQRLHIKLGHDKASLRPNRRRVNGKGAFSFSQKTIGEPKAPGIHELPQEPSDALVSLADLDAGRCRWPISGEALDMMFCGERAAGSYCTRHHSIAYRGRRAA